MSILSQALMRANLDFAIGNLPVTLQQVRPTTSVTTTFSASRQNVDTSFVVMMDGREETVDTRFYIDAAAYTTVPTKGWVLSDGTRNYKVQSTQIDSYGVGYRIECSSEHARS